MIGIKIKCLECQRKRNQLLQKLEHLRKTTKTKAIHENRTYAIYFDNEDKDIRACPASDIRHKEDVTDFEIISKYP